MCVGGLHVHTQQVQAAYSQKSNGKAKDILLDDSIIQNKPVFSVTNLN